MKLKRIFCEGIYNDLFTIDDVVWQVDRIGVWTYFSKFNDLREKEVIMKVNSHKIGIELTYEDHDVGICNNYEEREKELQKIADKFYMTDIVCSDCETIGKNILIIDNLHYFYNKNNQLVLKARVEKWKKTIVMQILEQDEKFINKTYEIENSKINISSYYRLDLCDNKIELRGNYINQKLYICKKLFKKNKERDKYYNWLIKQLKDWAMNWPGWYD